MRLDTNKHDRDGAGLTYIYPVISRRAQGVSIGINLNPNNACNFRCVYCQVPGLVAGKAPEVDLALFEEELRGFLEWVVNGDFMTSAVPEGSRRLNDLAFSGNGEPTSAREFEGIVNLVGEVLASFTLPPELKLILITNGSLVRQAHVQRGLQRLGELGGELWFKLDSATTEGQRRINAYAAGAEVTRANLAAAARACPTWLQTCVFTLDGAPPSRAECSAYLELLRWTRSEALPLQGILLYGLARESQQPEAARLGRVEEAWMAGFAEQLRDEGFEVRVSP